jgi:fatty acid desaturase
MADRWPTPYGSFYDASQGEAEAGAARGRPSGRPRGLFRYRADARSVYFVAAYALIATTGWLFAPPSVWVTVPWVAVSCVSAWIVGIVTHNAIHSPVFRSRGLNRAFQLWLSLSYGWPVSEFGPGHNLSHHKHTQTGKDLMRTTKVRSRSNMWNAIAFAPSVMFGVMRANYRFAARARATAPSWHRQLLVETTLVWTANVALAFLDWRRAALFVFIPHLVAVWGIVEVNFLWHDGCDEKHPFNHSRNFVGPIFNFFTLNNGFHAIHHDRPGLHWSLTPEAHARLLHGKIHPSLEQPSFFAYVTRTFVWPGRRVRYTGEPYDPVDPVDEPFLPALTDQEVKGLELP